jgi:mono/diheme cytochrome c family protein
MSLYRKTLLVLALGAGLAACSSPPAQTATAASAPDTTRGRLLYENSCNACHTTQPHWRSQRLVSTWSDLVGQVTRWQGIAGLAWSSDEIRDVAVFLNEQFYHLPCEACGGPSAALDVALGRRN